MNGENASTSYRSFLNQNCKFVYVDELRPSQKSITSFSNMWNKSISALAEMALSGNAMQNNVLDITRLIRESIPEAVVKVKNEIKNEKKIENAMSPADRNLVKILDNLCFNFKYANDFLKVLEKHILRLLQNRDSQIEDGKSWIVEIACCAQYLQESGSFKCAIWLHLRKLTAIAIAKVISCVDADDNLNLLKKASQVKLWLRIFDRPSFFALQWPVARF